MFTGGHCDDVGPRRLPAAGRPGLEQPPLGLGLRERRGHRRRHRRRRARARERGRARRPVLGGARRRARRSSASSRASTCARIRACRCSTTRGRSGSTISSRCCTGCTSCCPTLDVAVEPVMPRRARRRPAAAAHDADRGRRDAGRAAARAVRRRARADAVAHERGPTTIVDGERRAGGAEPGGPPLRGRLAVDGRRRGDAVPAAARDLRGRCRPSDSFSIWYGWAPTRDAARHGVLARAQRLPRDLRDLAGRGGRRAHARVGARPARAARRQVGEGVYVGDSDFARRPDRYLATPMRPPGRDPRGTRSRGTVRL